MVGAWGDPLPQRPIAFWPLGHTSESEPPVEEELETKPSPEASHRSEGARMPVGGGRWSPVRPNNTNPARQWLWELRAAFRSHRGLVPAFPSS